MSRWTLEEPQLPGSAGTSRTRRGLPGTAGAACAGPGAEVRVPAPGTPGSGIHPGAGSPGLGEHPGASEPAAGVGGPGCFLAEGHWGAACGVVALVPPFSGRCWGVRWVMWGRSCLSFPPSKSSVARGAVRRATGSSAACVHPQGTNGHAVTTGGVLDPVAVSHGGDGAAGPAAVTSAHEAAWGPSP